MMKTKRVKFTVSMAVLDYMPASWARDYVKDALESWRGSLRPPGGHGENDPGDSMWHMDPDTVKVAYVKKKS